MTLKKIGSFDFTSSYPTVMIAEKFPMGRGQYRAKSTIKEIEELSEENCCMFRIKFDFITAKTRIEHPLSASKCRSTYINKYGKTVRNGWVLDNGRIVTAADLETTCTEQDLEIYKRFYEFSDDSTVTDVYVYPKAYLPTSFVQAILQLYKDKTKLKDVDGEEVNYLISKGMLNSAYGMAVTDIVREILSYVDDEFSSNYTDMTDEEYERYLEEQISAYNSNPYRFLFYPWGVWVTAYSRKNLFTGIDACGDDYVYSDTDSIKIKNPDNHMDYINWYNDGIIKKLKEAAEFHGFDIEDIMPENKNGDKKPLGIWEFEGIYDEFKTLGAKRYLWRKGEKYQITVAGVKKTSGVEYIKKIAEKYNESVDEKHKKSPFDFFNLDLVFPETDSGRLVLTYIDDPQSAIIKDYLGEEYEYSELSAIHMEASTYSMNPVDNFISFLFTVSEERW